MKTRILVTVDDAPPINLKCEPEKIEDFIKEIFEIGISRETQGDIIRVYHPSRIKYVEFGIPSSEEPMTGKEPTSTD